MIAFYAFCHYGDKLTERYENVGGAIHRMAWYLLPVKIRRKLPTTLAIAQKRVYVRGSAQIFSTRTLFMEVIDFLHGHSSFVHKKYEIK